MKGKSSWPVRHALLVASATVAIVLSVAHGETWKTTEISVPVAISVFREDAFRPIETWAQAPSPA